MNNQVFESANLIIRYKKQKVMLLYYIDELNGHLYIADRKFVSNKYRDFEIIDNNEVIIIEDFMDQTTRQMKGYTSKEYALSVLEKIKHAME